MRLSETWSKRRGFLKGIGTTGLGISLASTNVLAEDGQREPLTPVPLKFNLYWSAMVEEETDPDEPADYGYPLTPSDPGDNNPSGKFLEAFDPSGEAFFDVGEMELTPNKQTLHHALQFFLGFLLQNDPKPYVLVQENGNPGRYSSRGQSMNFSANPWPVIERVLSNLPTSGLNIVDLTPLVILGGGNKGEGNRDWRAVGTDRVQLQIDGGTVTTEPEWALTRVDFYSRGKDSPSFTLSLLYVIWASQSPNTSIPSDTDDIARTELINPGRLNSGGQRKTR